ncbi:MAG: hypothetical protein IT368_11895 [Candidatus Hydrogenedentes bacterium]|nr:hypothetical protein [Candidatus Hydrogenedentota bacterium]
MSSGNLDRRERIGLTIGGVAFLFVLALLLYVPLGPRQDYLASKQELLRLQRQLATLQSAKIDEEERLRTQEVLRERLAARPPGFDLLAFLNGALRDSGLTDRYELQSGRPPGNANDPGTADLVTAQLRVSGVTLTELLDFLHRVYANQNLIVLYKLDWLRATPNNQGLDLNVTFLTIRA